MAEGLSVLLPSVPAIDTMLAAMESNNCPAAEKRGLVQKPAGSTEKRACKRERGEAKGGDSARACGEEINGKRDAGTRRGKIYRAKIFIKARPAPDPARAPPWCQTCAQVRKRVPSTTGVPGAAPASAHPLRAASPTANCAQRGRTRRGLTQQGPDAETCFIKQEAAPSPECCCMPQELMEREDRVVALQVSLAACSSRGGPPALFLAPNRRPLSACGRVAAGCYRLRGKTAASSGASASA